MEFFRKSLVQWIYLFFESEDPKYKTFGDAWKFYSEGFGREAKTAVQVLSSMRSDGLDFSKEEDKNFCREKLQDFRLPDGLALQPHFYRHGRGSDELRARQIQTESSERC